MEVRNSIAHRKQRLETLLHVVRKHEKDVIAALHSDFAKPEFEAVVTETVFVMSDIAHTVKNLSRWSRRERVTPSLLNFPSRDYIYREPYGKVLIIAPWNYPFQLALGPLVAAVAAGNQVVLKPSELTPNVASMIELIISETFDPTEVEVFQGGSEVAQHLLQRRWDYIFFTGSVAVGKLVAKAAAEHLTPVTLELGGKSPCIIDASADLKVAARRIVWGKFLNAGQTCIAPDYLLVHHSIKGELVSHLAAEITKAFGTDPSQSPDLARIVNDRHFRRLASYLDGQSILLGGVTDPATRYISPTLLNQPESDSDVMSHEIFGPILPVLSYRDEDELDRMIKRKEKPLSLYIFTSNDAWAERLISRYSFGGGCVNDVIIHVANRRLPFGGVGESGMGSYHGKTGFDTFSHKKSIVHRGTWFDPSIRYAPYGGKLKWIRPLLKWFN